MLLKIDWGMFFVSFCKEWEEVKGYFLQEVVSFLFR